MLDATAHLPDVHDPCKDAAWRWHRTGYLLDHGRQLQSQDDDLTRHTWHFRKALTCCRTDADREQLALEFPGLAEAHSVYTGEQLKRWELEACLLGGDPDVAVAARCGISVQGVEDYHNTFYEVRPHLHADTYVNSVLIGPKAHYRLTVKDHEQLLKLFGYGLGGPGVDAYLDYLQDPPTVPASLDDLDLPTLKQLCRRLRTKVMVLLLTAPAKAARPETWKWLEERFAAQRELPGDDEGAALASTHGLPSPPRVEEFVDRLARDFFDGSAPPDDLTLPEAPQRNPSWSEGPREWGFRELCRNCLTGVKYGRIGDFTDYYALSSSNAVGSSFFTGLPPSWQRSGLLTGHPPPKRPGSSPVPCPTGPGGIVPSLSREDFACPGIEARSGRRSR
jgi:hypothetical protein